MTMKEGLVKVPLFLQKGGPKKIAIALSGGVDSSVVAYLMRTLQEELQNPQHEQQQQQQQQHELIAVHMSNWNTSDEDDPYCTKERDWKDAQAVADQLHLPLHPTSFAADYWTQVFEPFTAGVEQGSRPNPDVHCNRFIKFGALRDFVQTTLKADVLATGHYARLWDRSNVTTTTTSQRQTHPSSNPYHDLIEEMLQEDPRNAPDWIRTWGSRTSTSASLSPLLLAARDRSKCQSLFLSAVPGTAFHNVMFPLGDLMKKNTPNNKNSSSETATSATALPTVREIAHAANLPTASKKDSMGICFVGKRPGGFNEFIDQYFATVDEKAQAQPLYQFVNVDTGEGVSTTHHMVYARGQRAKISGASKAWFVVQTDRATRSILVCQGTHHPALYTDQFYIREFHWIGGDIPTPLQKLATDTTRHRMGNAASPSSASTTITSTRQQLPVLQAMCRIRNLQPLVMCDITYDPDTRMYQVRTEKPLRAVTPGQHCAIYVGKEGLVCLGGGTILERGPTYQEQNKCLDTTNLHPAGHNDLSVLQKEQQQTARTVVNYA